MKRFKLKPTRVLDFVHYATLAGVVGVGVNGFYGSRLTWDSQILGRRLMYRVIGFTVGAIAINAAVYGWWLWRVAQMARKLGSVTDHEEALNDLLDLGRRAVPMFIRALTAPALQWRRGSGKVQWDVDIARRLSAEGLERLKDPAAVEALIETLDEDDVALRAKAMVALKEIGSQNKESRGAVVAALIPSLGDDRRVTMDKAERFDGKKSDAAYLRAIQRTLQGVVDQRLNDLALEVLDALGERELAYAFIDVLNGDLTALEVLRRHDRPKVVAGLVRALDSEQLQLALRAVEALVTFKAAEAVPALRAKTGVFSGVSLSLKEACKRALESLEGIITLPRSADMSAIDPTMLPRTAQPSIDREHLPRATAD